MSGKSSQVPLSFVCRYVHTCISKLSLLDKRHFFVTDGEEKEQIAKKQKLSSSEDEKKRSRSPETSFPTTLEGFKYHFNAGIY